MIFAMCVFSSFPDVCLPNSLALEACECQKQN